MRISSGDAGASGMGHVRSMVRQLLPGMVLPGVIYLLARPHTSVIVALAMASSVPAVDAIVRTLRGRRPSPVGLVFVATTGVSIGLAVVLRSPVFILAKSAAMSCLLGLAFALSAWIRRPLCRTLALRLSTDDHEHRRHLAGQWGQPRALDVFRVLSMGWGLLLIGMAAEQMTLVLTVSPGTMMAVDAPVHAVFTVMGVIASIVYVRRIQQEHPEIGLLPVRGAAAA